MLTLYVKTDCPFCMKVLAAGKDLGIEFTEKNIADQKNLEELIEKGGKRQVPYLIDTSTGVEMYESDDIAEYLRKNFDTNK